MKIVGYHIAHDGTVFISDGAVYEPPIRMEYLQDTQQGVINVFYHLNWAVANLLSRFVLTEKQLQTLDKARQLHVAPYQLSYIPNKYFSVRYGGGISAPFTNFSDMAQYMPKHDFTLDGATLAKKAAEVGQQVYDALTNIGLKPVSLTSPIRAYERDILQNTDLPTIDHMPEQAGEYAYNCCHGGWLEAFYKGHWDKAYDYDLTSAYPNEVRKLLDLRNGKWVQGEYDSNALYGFAKCNVNIYRNFSPILYGTGEALFTPTGEWETYLTKDEIEFINHWGLGSVQVLDGWWWIPDYDNLVQPLKAQMDWLWEKKNKATGMDLDVIKRIMAGSWGKFLETRDDAFGPFFNPVWGAIVESRVRLRVADLCLVNEVTPLHVAVDGLVTAQPLLIPQDKGMGNWRMSHSGACYVISSGMVAMQNKSNGQDFSLEYDWLRRQIADKPGEQTYSMEKLSPMTLPKAVIQNKLAELGVVSTITKTVDVEHEIKRMYREVPTTGLELQSKVFESEPWDISMMQVNSLLEEKTEVPVE